MANEAPIVNNHMYSKELTVDYDKLKQIVQAGGLFEREDLHTETRFAKFGYLDPYFRVGHTYEYVFFTKPDLYIMRSTIKNANDNASLFGSGTNLPIFDLAQHLWDYSLKDLQLRRVPFEPFSAILYNHRASNLDLPDLSAQEMETGENMWGNKLYYRRSSITSADDFEFSMEFKDNKFLDCYMFFRLYEEYEDRKSQGMINLYEDEQYRDYIYSKRLHDQMSVYKFIVGEDGRELLHWSKLYGVYPKGCPRSVFGDMPEDGNFKFSITFKANFVDDMKPDILADFNKLSLMYRTNGGTEIKAKLPDEHSLYDMQEGFVTNTFANPPFFHWEETARRNTAGYNHGYKIVMLWGE